MAGAGGTVGAAARPSFPAVVRHRSPVPRRRGTHGSMSGLSSPPWLAIDTATDIASVATGSAGRVLATLSIRGARQHAAQIIHLVQQVLAQAHVPLKNIAGVV